MLPHSSQARQLRLICIPHDFPDLARCRRSLSSIPTPPFSFCNCGVAPSPPTIPRWATVSGAHLAEAIPCVKKGQRIGYELQAKKDHTKRPGACDVSCLPEFVRYGPYFESFPTARSVCCLHSILLPKGECSAPVLRLRPPMAVTMEHIHLEAHRSIIFLHTNFSHVHSQLRHGGGNN